MKSYTQPIQREVINAGKIVERYNIKAIYKPVDEALITQQEVVDEMTGESILIDEYPELEIDYWIYDERVIYLPCFALCTFGEYFKLNHDLSVARGWSLGGATERCLPMNPRAAKTDIKDDGSYSAKLVAEITSEWLQEYPHLFEGKELVDSYIPVDGQEKEFFADISDFEVVDWTIQHFVKIEGIGEELTIYVSEGLYNALREEYKMKLSGIGINVLAK